MEFNTKSRGILVFVVLASIFYMASSLRRDLSVDQNYYGTVNEVAVSNISISSKSDVLFFRELLKQFGDNYYDVIKGKLRVKSSGDYRVTLRVDASCPEGTSMMFDIKSEKQGSIMSITIGTMGVIEIWRWVKGVDSCDDLYVNTHVQSSEDNSRCFIKSAAFHVLKGKEIMLH